jgi:hypothetical protein
VIKADAKKNKKFPPSLEKLLGHLEAANRNSPDALKHLKFLAADTDRVIERIEHVHTKFAAGKTSEEV